jgi:UDP-N-acetylmuramoyl-tripeptide--D-alanyl-D-alanine ligase
MSLTVEEIVKATGGEPLCGDSMAFSGVSIDSRTVMEGEIFFALRGERFDGHDFLDSVLSTGSAAVVDHGFEAAQKGKAIIQVKDTLKALQDLAGYMRLKHDIPVVAITGSNGKTTTKEMTYSILSRRFKVLKNKGNLNNHIGLPLSLTRLVPSDEVMVLELGMNSTGEIRRLCEIAMPSHGVITNIGSAHIGRLGSRDAIRSAKLEMLEGITTAVLNGDDDFLMDGVRGFKGKIITFSIRSDSHIMAKDLYATERGNSFTLAFRDGKSVPVRLNVHGLFNVYNSLAASAVCFSLGMNIEEIRTALEAYTAFPMRFEVLRRGSITVINDSYNANPSSVFEALKELERMRGGGRLVAVLGDMNELGNFAEDAHRNVVKTVIELGIDVLVSVGEMMGLAAGETGDGINGMKPVIYKFGDVEELTLNIGKILMPGDTALVKGSRAMNMDRAVRGITDVI